MRVALKMATSLDGKIALANGQSKWITGPLARQKVQAIRGQYDAIITGIGTILADDPMMNVRDIATAKQPLRVILDHHGRTPIDSKIIQSASMDAPVLIITAKGVGIVWQKEIAQTGVQTGAQTITIGEKIEWAALLVMLESQFGIASALIEAGSIMAQSAFKANIIDELHWFVAPKILGGDGISAVGPLGLNELVSAPIFTLKSAEIIGEDHYSFLEKQRS